MTVTVYEDGKNGLVLKSDHKEFKKMFGKVYSTKRDLFEKMEAISEFVNNTIGEEVLFETV